MCKKIEDLLQQPESKTLEFKRDASSLRPIIKTVVAFANSAGGNIIIGVEDNGKVVGLTDPLQVEEKIASAITDSIKPMLMPDIEIVTIKNKSLLIIKVPHVIGPYYLKQMGDTTGVLVRVGSTNRQAGPDIIEEIKLKQTGGSYDALPCYGTTIKDFDSNLVNLLFSYFQHKPSSAKLKSLGLLVGQGKNTAPSNAGIILLGNEDIRFHKFAGARVSCARFADTTKAEFIDRLDIGGGILTAIDEAPKFIRRNTRMAAEIKSMKRRDIPEYSTEAVREALLNALLHSSYMLQGMRILVAIYSDRLEITNPGLLPVGISIEDLISGVSVVRNKIIGQVFKKMDLVETWGSGYERIMKCCSREGYPEPKWEELGSSIRVTFYPHPATITSKVGTKSAPSRHQVGTKSAPSRHQVGTVGARACPRPDASRQKWRDASLGLPVSPQFPLDVESALNKEQQRLLNFCKAERSLQEMMAILGWKDRTKFRNKYVVPLIDRGLLVMTIPDKPNSSKQRYVKKITTVDLA